MKKIEIRTPREIGPIQEMTCEVRVMMVGDVYVRGVFIYEIRETGTKVRIQGDYMTLPTKRSRQDAVQRVEKEDEY